MTVCVEGFLEEVGPRVKGWDGTRLAGGGTERAALPWASSFIRMSAAMAWATL